MGGFLRVNKKIRILVLSYSQTGRTNNILDVYIEPLRSLSFVQLEIVNVEPETPFPYPWPKLYFFSIMPETVYESPIPLKGIGVKKDAKYDYIILGCQVWFLSPSLPVSSLLQHPSSSLFSGTPVITVLTCRKMWAEALAGLELRLKSLNSWIADRIVVTAEGSQMQTLRRTRDNLFINGGGEGGQDKSKSWRVSSEELASVQRKGRQFSQYLVSSSSDPATTFISEVSPALKNYQAYHLEKIAKKNFMAWGKFMQARSAPKSRLRYFYTLVFSALFLARIFIGLPLIEVVAKIKSRVKKKEALHAVAFDQPVEREKD